MSTDTNLRLVRPEPIYPDAKRPTVFAEGVQFQDFVCQQLARRHVILQNFASKKYQLGVGENLQGFEIKLDTRCSETRRLSIEVAEKSRSDMPQFCASGIHGPLGAWLYIQGNYDILFVFATNILRLLHKSARYEEHEMPTLHKFYLPFADARKYAALTIDFSDIPF